MKNNINIFIKKIQGILNKYDTIKILYLASDNYDSFDI